MFHTLTRVSRRALAVGIVAGAAAAASPAHANTTPLGSTAINYTPASGTTCDRPTFTRALAAYGDNRWYALAPAGNFDGAAPGWQLKSGARLAADPARGTSLVLAPGASALSPGFCVDLDYPYFRFFNRFVAKDPSKGEILVEVVYPQLRNPEWTEVTKFDGTQGTPVSGSWRLSSDVALKPDFAGGVPGARYVALRFTALHTGYSGEWRVDDIWIDPRAKY